MFVSVRIGRPCWLVGLACWGICLLAIMPGCSCRSGVAANLRKPVFPVSGELYYEGQPAKHVMVILQPAEEAVRAEVWPEGFPKATVQADGSFRIGTYEKEDGAPAGEYVILVVPTDANLDEPQRILGDAGSRAPKAPETPGIGTRFSSVENPAGRCVVETKENKIPRLSLTRGA